MKTRHIIITVFCLFVSCQLFAQDIFREKADNWTKRESLTESRGNLINANTNPTNGDPGVTPVGDALLVVLGLTGVYAIAKARNIKKILS
ncbi:hypothetical protein M2138_000844 [Dysgonomonadaceae bacterium PH5-43]|nr:hypothetical protein [Dysgonomonadaceae bacterium PH5-43]